MAYQSLRAIARALPDASSVYNSDGLGPTLAQILEHDDGSGVRMGAASAPVTMALFDGGIVSAIYTTPGALDMLPLEYVSGGAYAAGDRAAVIPDSLAEMLPDQSPLAVDGISYAVAGVYADAPGFAEDVADGARRVYLFDAAVFENMEASELFMTGERNTDARFLARTVMNMLQTVPRGTLRDYSTRAELARGLLQLAQLLCAFLAAAIVLYYAGKSLVLTIEDALASKARRALRAGLGLSVIIAVIAELSFQLGALYIPGAYLPADNIFELRHYAGLLSSFLRLLREETNYFDWLYAAHMAAMLFWCAASVVFFAVGAVSLRRLSRGIWRVLAASRTERDGASAERKV
jgi:hypothetical protein